MIKRADWPDGPRSTVQAHSFDGAITQEVLVLRPDRYSFFRLGDASKYVIARGAGLSYAAASFGSDAFSVDMSSFNRVLAFCDKARIVEVEAGISLFELYTFLRRHGVYLPAQPGHGRLTIGGCIAANVHGKNQIRDGSFLDQVESVQLFHPDHGSVHLSRKHLPDIFHATCGGYGTTGIILSAQLRCTTVPGDAIQITTERVSNLGQVVDTLRTAATSRNFAYSWHDCTQMGSKFGRGYVTSGEFITNRSKTNIPETPPNNLPRRPWPIQAFNRTTTRFANLVHYNMHRNKTRLTSLHDTLFPIHGVERYFNAFGRKGFHESQALVPYDRVDEYVAELRSAIDRHRIAITLASAKAFAGDAHLIRFEGNGLCLAVNIPRDRNSHNFMTTLDNLLLRVGGRPNIIKDSRLPRSVIEASYPELPRLRATLHDWDRQRRFRSELSERIGL